LDVIRELVQLPAQQRVFFAVVAAALDTVVTLIKQWEHADQHVSVADLHNVVDIALYTDVIALQ